MNQNKPIQSSGKEVNVCLLLLQLKRGAQMLLAIAFYVFLTIATLPFAWEGGWR